MESRRSPGGSGARPEIARTRLRPPPDNPKTIPRVRLEARLGGALRGSARLILVSAPAGYGKTTLVAQWLRGLAGADGRAGGREDPETAAVDGPGTGWLSLDKADDEPASFLRAFAASLESAAPGLIAAVQALLAAPQLPAPGVLAASLINALASATRDRRPPDLVSVLDDYHLIRNPAIHEVLGAVIEGAPAGFLLVILTRSDPPLPLHRLRARGQLLEVRADRLAFTLEETGRFFEDISGFSLAPEVVELLERKSEGWAAGIQMAALSLRPGESPESLLAALEGRHRFVIDYLTEEVLSRQPPELRSFLLETSALERFCGPLVEAVLPPELLESLCRTYGSGQGVLEHLEATNLFVIPLDDERRWYRYHHLFQGLLQVRRQAEVGSAAAAGAEPPAAAGSWAGRAGTPADVHRRAAAWLEAQGLIAEAIHHYLAAGAREAAGSLVEGHAVTLLSEGRLQDLLAWMGRLPAEPAARRPWLTLGRAWVLAFGGKLEEARLLAEQLETGPGPESLAGELAALRGYLAVTTGDVTGALALASVAAEIRSTATPFGQSVLRWSLGYAYRLTGRLEEALSEFEAVRRLGRSMANPWTVQNGGLDLGNVLRLRGRLREAERTYRGTLEETRPIGGAGGEPGYVGRLESFLASLLYEKNELEEALTLTRSAVRHNLLWRNPNHDVHAFVTLARIHLARSEPEESQEALDRAEGAGATGPVIPSLRAAAEAAQVRLWLKRGELNRALEWTADGAAGARIGEAGVGETGETKGLSEARVRLAAGRPEGALQALRPLVASARQSGAAWRLIEALTLAALAEEAAGERTAALGALNEALALGWPAGFRRVFLDEGEPLRMLVEADAAALRKARRGSPAETSGDTAGRPAPAAGAAALGQVLDQAVRELRQLFGGSAGVAAGPLTPRELEVLRLLAEGLPNKEIAYRLALSTGTVKAHTAAIYRKLDALNRTEAVTRAREAGLL